MSGKCDRVTKMRRYSFFILSFFSVLTGYVLYLGWRDVLPSWGFVLHNRECWYFFRHHLGDDIPLPEWVVYSLPQGLWAFGLSLFMGGIWYTGPHNSGYFWLNISLMLVVLWEVFQRLGYISGTFCWIDVLTGICGVGVGVILFTFKKLES